MNLPIDWNRVTKWAVKYTESKKYSASYRRIIRATMLYTLTPLEVESFAEDIDAIKNWEPKEEYPDDEYNGGCENGDRKKIRSAGTPKRA